MSLIPQLGLPTMGQKQIRSYHGRSGLWHYTVEPRLHQPADSDLNPSLGEVPMLTERLFTSHKYVWIHKMSDFSNFRKYVILCKMRVLVC
jgi:hypothetical protein